MIIQNLEEISNHIQEIYTLSSEFVKSLVGKNIEDSSNKFIYCNHKQVLHGALVFFHQRH